MFCVLPLKSGTIIARKKARFKNFLMVSFFRQIRYTDERERRDLMEITSVHNPKVKEWCRLHQKKHRDREGLFLIEGMHLVEEAHRAGLIEPRV